MGSDRQDAEFPSPPRTVVDREEREITLRAYEPDDYEALVEMYRGFDPSDRAQGVPPVNEGRIREWLDTLLDGDQNTYNVLAVHDGRAVGHATLVPDGAGAHELAIFVVQSYQGAGIGTVLIESLLGHGADNGADDIWLTVERWNRPAVSLYEKVGFETTGAESFEMEMALRLG